MEADSLPDAQGPGQRQNGLIRMRGMTGTYCGVTQLLIGVAVYVKYVRTVLRYFGIEFSVREFY